MSSLGSTDRRFAGVLALATLAVASLAHAGAASPPALEFTHVPTYGAWADDLLQGRALNVTPASYKIAVYIYVFGWWTKPYSASPTTDINADGTWSCLVHTGGNDAYATKMAAFLIPASYGPPILGASATLPQELYDNSVAHLTVDVNPPKLHFSGYDWSVKGGYWGPGPNYFGDSNDNVWVDLQGRLHLRLTNRGGTWYCAEVYCTRGFGNGTYRFDLDTPVDNLDPNLVLGLFTWSDDVAYAHREIDVEFSRWSVPTDPNSQYVVQPYDLSGHRNRWSLPAGLTKTAHLFRWGSSSVAFTSTRVEPDGSSTTADLLKQWTCASAPPPGDETPRINLWLYKGAAPTDGMEREVIISRFSFTPPGTPGDPVISPARVAGDLTKANVHVGRSFDDPGGCTSYKVYRIDTTSTTTYTEIANIPAAGKDQYTCQDTGLDAARPYRYGVRAYNGSLASGLVTCALVNPSITPRDPGLSGTRDVDPTKANVKITKSPDDPGGCTSYTLCRLASATGAKWLPVANISATGAATYAYQDRGLDPASGYRYGVRACNNWRTSDLVTCTLVNPSITPRDPTLKLTNVGGSNGTQVDVTIGKSPDDPTGCTAYIVWRRTLNPNGVFVEVKLLNATGAPTYTWRDTGLTLGTQYQYAVQACNGPNRSALVYAKITTQAVAAAAVLAAHATAAATRTGGAQAVISLSCDARLSVDVVNIAGVCIRRVCVNRGGVVGANVILWDGRSQTGTRVPSGRYWVKVTAGRDDGQQTAVVAPLLLR